MDNGIGEMSHLMSVEIEGFKFAVEMGRDAVKFLQRLMAIFANALKWGLIDKDWRYGKEAGKTNIYNLKRRSNGAMSVLEMSITDVTKWEKFAKKYGILYCKAPCAKEEKVCYYYGQNDADLVKHFSDLALSDEEKNKVKEEKKGSNIEKVEGEVVYEPPRSMNFSEYMYENGFMDCSDEEFDDILLETYGEQCTTLTEYKEQYREPDPVKQEAQKKRSIELYRKGAIDELKRESKTGAYTILLEKNRFAGMNKNKGMAYFQITKDPPQWVGIPSNRFLKTKDGNFQAVINSETKLSINTVQPDENAPHGFRFEEIGEISIDQIQVLDKTWREDIENERRAAREAANEIMDQTKETTKETAVALVGARGHGKVGGR